MHEVNSPWCRPDDLLSAWLEALRERVLEGSDGGGLFVTALKATLQARRIHNPRESEKPRQLTPAGRSRLLRSPAASRSYSTGRFPEVADVTDRFIMACHLGSVARTLPPRAPTPGDELLPSIRARRRDTPCREDGYEHACDQQDHPRHAVLRRTDGNRNQGAGRNGHPGQRCEEYLKGDLHPGAAVFAGHNRIAGPRPCSEALIEHLQRRLGR